MASTLEPQVGSSLGVSAVLCAQQSISERYILVRHMDAKYLRYKLNAKTLI